MNGQNAIAMIGLVFLLATTPAVGQENGDDLLKTFVSEFVVIEPGKPGFPSEVAIGEHRVTISKPFQIARYETPQNLYKLVMGTNPSRWKGQRNAVEMMTWSDANQFCDKITATLKSAKLILADEAIRLPSEVEWEYCCRAGTTTRYSFGDQARGKDDAGKIATILDQFGWHSGNAAGNDPPVGAKKPNPWGLYDMHGYLWEITNSAWSDPFDPLQKGTPQLKEACVIRGGSWKDRFELLQSNSRREFKATDKDDAVGFRCVRAKQP